MARCTPSTRPQGQPPTPIPAVGHLAGSAGQDLPRVRPEGHLGDEPGMGHPRAHRSSTAAGAGLRGHLERRQRRHLPAPLPRPDSPATGVRPPRSSRGTPPTPTANRSSTRCSRSSARACCCCARKTCPSAAGRRRAGGDVVHRLRRLDRGFHRTMPLPRLGVRLRRPDARSRGPALVLHVRVASGRHLAGWAGADRRPGRQRSSA